MMSCCNLARLGASRSRFTGRSINLEMGMVVTLVVVVGVGDRGVTIGSKGGEKGGGGGGRGNSTYGCRS